MNTLHQLLDDGIRYDPHYLPSMNSDHMPMTLCAIVGLGGTIDDCLAYRDDYSRILHEFEPLPAIEDWRAGLGDDACYPALQGYFLAEIKKRGISETVSQYLPQILPGLAMDAFHPIIRLGYAIDFESDSESAAALAYMVSCHRPVPTSNTPLSISGVLQSQAEQGSLALTQNRFGALIQELIDQGVYPVGCAASLEACARSALDVYLGTRNFFALHLVTATQAVRICSRLVDEEVALSSLTGSILASHLALGSPTIGEPQPVPDRLDREHTFKYAWACLSEYREYGDPRYLAEIRGFREAGLIPAWCARA